MKNLIVLAVATLFATNAVAAEMKWTGSTGWRWNHLRYDDGLNSTDASATPANDSKQTTKRHQIRANLGVMGGWEHVEYGFGMRTTGAANSDYVAVSGNADRTLGVEQAWFRYLRDFGSLDLSVTVGRQKSALVSDTQWETLYSNDVRWDGFGWNLRFGMFGLNAAQYVLGGITGNGTTTTTQGGTTQGSSSITFTPAQQDVGTTKRKFAMLYAFQPYMNWKFNDEIEAMFAVAYNKYVDEGHTNTAGGTNPAAWNSAGATTAKTAATYKMHNRAQWDFLTTWTLPYNLGLTAEFVKASKAEYNAGSVSNYGSTVAVKPAVSATAWNVGLTYGKLHKAQDFTVGYAYGNKGIASMINDFANERFSADNKGHQFTVGYAMADNFHLGFKGYFLNEKQRLDPATGLAYAGTNASQQLKTRWMELTAGVAF